MSFHHGHEHKIDPYAHPGARPHELGTIGASSRAGWVAGILLLLFIGVIVLGAISGGGSDRDDQPAAVTAPGADAGSTPAAPAGTVMTPTPEPVE